MSESAIDAGSGPSLESILWRSLDQRTEGPGLIDRGEFAEHIAGAFNGEAPAEAWVNRFFEGDPADRIRKPADMAEAIVHATRERLQVYEFDLRKLEYVIVEDREKMVVVSDFGQFAVEKDDTVSRLIESAVLRDRAQGLAAGGSAGDGAGSDPRVYLIRENGQVVAVDVKKIARALDQLALRQVSTPLVDDPGLRMLPFAPVKRRMSEAREERALRQDLRTRQSLPPPALHRSGGGDQRDLAGRSSGGGAVPASAAATVFVLLPDGSLARPSIGSATRWQDMVSEWSLRAQSLTPGASGRPMAVSGSQRFTRSAGTVVALFTMSGGAAAPGNPGFAGERALAQGDGISAVRAGGAPVRVLGDDELARAIAQGAMIVPGRTGAISGTFAEGFWIQPEGAFTASRAQQRTFSQGGGTATLVQSAAAEGARPLQLGQITGDPWTDWALSGGGDLEPSMLRAAKGRARQYLAAPGRDTDGPAARPINGRQLLLNGTPALAFLAPDGSLVVQREKGTIRLAGIGRGDVSGDAFNTSAGPGQQLSLRRRVALAERSGAIPATALAALQLALETSANTSGYKLPRVKIESANDALDMGRASQLDATDPRRSSARLAGPVVLAPGGGGQVAQMVLSMPFPNAGEVHVGSDLSEALQAYLGAPVVPAGSAGGSAAPAFGGGSTSGLPSLLRSALAQGGAWTPGPGGAMPSGARSFALQGPFDLPELVSSSGDISSGSGPQRLRPLNAGEDEIIIPMPLWTQMGRGRMSSTNDIMASPLAGRGYAPPLGMYRLVLPGGGPIDAAGGAPAGTPGVLQITGPTALELATGARGGAPVSARSLGGSQLLGTVAVDDADSVMSRRGGSAATLVSGGTFVSDGDAGFASRAAAAGRAQAQSFGAGASTGTLVSGTSGPSSPAQIAGAASAQAASSVSSAANSASSVRDAASRAPIVSAGSASSVTGLAPGAWSGARRDDAGYQTWSYSPTRSTSVVTSGGVSLSSLGRPGYPSLPTALRFRYAGAPLWWSRSTRSMSAAGGDDTSDTDSAPARALRSGVRAANSASAIWRSIFVSGASAPSAAQGSEGSASGDATGGMGGNWDAHAARMGSLGAHLDALAGASLVAGAGAAAGKGAETVYVAMNGSGGAGAMRSSDVQRARAQALEMSIVAAIPPAPPPIETMGSGAMGGDSPHARHRGHGNGGGEHHKESAGDVSQSKLEGSVDAVAQRIYHRIRRRIQSDRERFGG